MAKRCCRSVDFEECACSGKTLGKLVRPCILALLARGPAHGYALLDQLDQSGLLAAAAPNHSVVYRALNSMEKEGLVTSTKSTSRGGPARWDYELTATGRACLQRWQNSLTGYRAAIDSLLKLIPARR